MKRIILELFLISLTIGLGWQFYTLLHFSRNLDEILYLTAAIHLARSIAYLIRKRLRLFRDPRQRQTDRPLLNLLAVANECLFSIILVAAIHMSVFKNWITQDDYRTMTHFTLLLLALICLLSWKLRRARKLPFLHVAFLGGTLLLGTQIVRSFNPPPLDQSVVLEPPFSTGFSTMNGGNNRLQNMHSGRSPSYFLGIYAISETPFRAPGVTDDELAMQTLGTPIHAPAAGTVIEVVADLPDMSPGQQDYSHLLGNHIILQIAPDQYLHLANLQQSSIRVSVGQRVSAGDLIANAGSSGKAMQAALYLAIVDRPSIFDPEVVSLPFYFQNVIRHDSAGKPGPHFPVRNDFFLPHPPTNPTANPAAHP